MKSNARLNIFICFVIFLSTFLFSRASASDISSNNFIVRDPVISAGGGYGSSATFQLFNSQDSLFTNANSSASFLGRYGFLYFSDVVTPSPTPSPTPTPSGGGAGPGTLYPQFCGKIADFNCDGRVDLLDFSILLYFAKQRGLVNPFYDLNHDGKLNLADISVMFYYWGS